MHEQHEILGIGILKQKVIASDLIEIQLPLEFPIQIYCMALIAWGTCKVYKISVQANIPFWGRFGRVTLIYSEQVKYSSLISSLT